MYGMTRELGGYVERGLMVSTLPCGLIEKFAKAFTTKYRKNQSAKVCHDDADLKKRRTKQMQKSEEHPAKQEGSSHSSKVRSVKKGQSSTKKELISTKKGRPGVDK